MSALILAPQFAAVDRMRGLESGFRSAFRGDPLAFIWLVVGCAIAGLIALVVMQFRRRNDMSLRCDDPEKLFRELAKAHHLTGSNQRVLRALVDANHLTNPGQIFLSTATFDAASGVADPALSQEFTELRMRLFGN